ncbi:RNA-directed RNA polymerase [ssRNA phage SRR5208570_1]|uniref:RNA-directed RNA polymerase n=1 Tax=ssRNA phage SRR5208570_1 TaxID=2786378 RepID=A0A8S5KZY9_9VIRU|nr:RNA-directed RNA polymerase [ssRNA phage SRR5208570_1]DAD50764.1 TPA_asm: RNA-directed RNA polymerase [ssRNA phage SRR5208570_1]
MKRKHKSVLEYKKYSRDRLNGSELVLTRSESSETLDAVFFHTCSSVDSPRSLAAWLLYESKEFGQLVRLEMDPDHYQCAERYADDALVTKMLSKYPEFKHESLDPEGTAKASFVSWEAACALTNRKFRKLDLDPSLWDPMMLEIFSSARRKIRSILRKPDLDSISEKFAWGPGVTTSTSGPETSAYAKFGNRLDVTSNSLVMGHCCVNSTPSWVNCQLQTDNFPSIEVSLTYDAFDIVRGNEIVFVPKNAKTHRVIAKEPHVNSYLQKGYGSEIRSLLKRYAGIDLNDQSINQRLALLGSLNNLLATIDLSGASDTISYELVKFLLPEDWFNLLDSCRSKQGLFEKNWISFEKFSSMGNGFTFELESLIFYALAKASVEYSRSEIRLVSVYGDDIIVPSESYEVVAKVIEYAGFTMNETKSFANGPFRESCGKDYFLGHDVRPIFIKESISTYESIFKLANSIRRYSHRRNFNYGCDNRFLAIWDYLYTRVGKDFRSFLIPDGFGDSGFIVNFDEAAPFLHRAKHGWEGFVFDALIRLPLKKGMRDEHRAYTAMLSAAGAPNFDGLNKGVNLLKEAVEEKLPLLGHHDLRRKTYLKKARIHTNGWYDLGPWI